MQNELLNSHVRKIIGWHFNPETGSKFWLKKKETLSFNPIQDVKTYQDLKLFPDFSDDFRSYPIEEIIPQGFKKAGIIPDIFESGGATGKPKRIIEVETRTQGVEWINSILDMHGFPDKNLEGEWLFIGPSGPHIVGRSMGRLAKLRGSSCFYIDFDPRWVRKCIKEKDHITATKYVTHLIQQIKDIIEEQSIKVLFVTPSVLETIISDVQLFNIVQKKIKGLIWSGTSLPAESIKYLKKILPNTVVIGLYGNTLMGIAGQKPFQDIDQYQAIFYPFFPYSIVDVVQFDDPTHNVDFYQVGQVKVTLLTKEMFIPNNLERDQAARIPPSEPFFHWDGLADIKPILTKGNLIIEGVY